MWQIVRGNMDKTQRALHAKHGPMIRLAPNEVACSDPEAIKVGEGLKSRSGAVTSRLTVTRRFMG